MKHNQYHILSVVCLVLIANVALAQNSLDIVADVIQFRGDASSTIVEFQYSFPDTAVRYVETQGEYKSEIQCRLTIVTSTADTVLDEWIASASSETSRFEHRQYYSGVRPLILAPGRIMMYFTAKDLNDSLRKTYSSFAIVVRDFGLNTDMSDIMFTQPKTSASDSRFDRNGVDAMPNPRHECLGVDPSIPVYLEVYNAKLNGLDSFVVEYRVTDNVQREMFTMYRPLVAVADGLVVRDDLPAGLIKSGVYYLHASVRSRDLEKTYATVNDKLYILNPEMPPTGSFYLTEEQQFLNSEWAIVQGDRLALELELVNVLATPAERTTAESLTDPRAQQRFLYRFWTSRDPEPSTSENERLEEFRRMFKRASTFYTSATMRDGWRTDRGRILMKYGIPTQLEQFVQTLDTKPYEIWFYQNVQGGAQIVFVDWQLTQNHKLVHSTIVGETRNPNWFNQWAKAFSPDINPTESIQSTAR